MRLAVFSDVHGCLEALEAVLAAIASRGVDRWLCLGDLVGYGPSPGEVVARVRELEAVQGLGPSVLLGNHDAGVAGRQSLDMFRQPNRRLLEVSRGLLAPGDLEWLRGLPLVVEGGGSGAGSIRAGGRAGAGVGSPSGSASDATSIRSESRWVAAHSSPVEPERWQYLDSAMACQAALRALPAEVAFCFVGHTHRAGVVADAFGVFSVRRGNRYVINPGCLFHPRSEERRATFCVMDTESFAFEAVAVPYDRERTMARYAALGFSREEAEWLGG